jgi:hypothetical protein
VTKQEAKEFLAQYFSLSESETKELEKDYFLDTSCADLVPDGWQIKFEFFDLSCLVHHYPYYKGERMGTATAELVPYSEFKNYIIVNN